MGGGSHVSAHVSPLYGGIPDSELPTVSYSVLVRLGDSRSMKPYYQDDRITIYNGDALEILPTLPLNTYSLCATDPPYFRIVDDEWDDQWGADVNKFYGWIGDTIELIKPTLIERGTIAVFCHPDHAWGVETEVRKRYAFMNHITWNKGLGRLGKMDKSTMRRYFPTSERIIIAEQMKDTSGDPFRYRSNVRHETMRNVYEELRLCLCEMKEQSGLSNKDIDKALGKSGMAGHYFGASQWAFPTEEAWDIIAPMFHKAGVEVPTFEHLRERYESKQLEFKAYQKQFDSHFREFETNRKYASTTEKDILLLTDVWSFKTPLGKERTKHPTQKPVELMRHMIESMSRKDDIILDPFLGSGTTLRAAVDLGRRAVGIEIDEEYCEIAARRLAQEVLPL